MRKKFAGLAMFGEFCAYIEIEALENCGLDRSVRMRGL